MSIKRNAILVFLSILIWSCTQKQSTYQRSTDKHALIYQELLGMEYGLLTSDYDLTMSHSSSLDELLKVGYDLFCPEESSKIDGARLTNAILKQHINENKSKVLLDDLRLLKACIINLETDDDYDPYFAFLWRFEEDLYEATSAAMDPMLGLYEWNEFNSLVACMNDSWQPVRMHYPSPKFLNNNTLTYKNQTKFKIYLENALAHFNHAVESADYKQYPLCDAAEMVRKSYVEYIYSFIQNPNDPNSFLAKL